MGQVHWSVPGWISRLCLRVSARPVPQGVLPGGPRCVLNFWLSLALSRVLHCPLLGFSVASPALARGLGLSFVPYPLFCRLGLVPRSVAQLCSLFASVSLLDPGALSPLLHRVFPDGFRHWCAFRFCRGASPLAFGPVGALGESWWLHLYRLTPDLVGLRHFAGCHWSSGRVFYVLLCDIPPVFMAIIWSVSLTPACPLRVIPIRGCSLDTYVACDWLEFLSSSSLFRDCHLR